MRFVGFCLKLKLKLESSLGRGRSFFPRTLSLFLYLIPDCFNFVSVFMRRQRFVRTCVRGYDKKIYNAPHKRVVRLLGESRSRRTSWKQQPRWPRLSGGREVMNIPRVILSLRVNCRVCVCACSVLRSIEFSFLNRYRNAKRKKNKIHQSFNVNVTNR